MRWSPEMVRPAGGTPAVHQTRRTHIASQWIASLWPARGPLDSMDLMRA